MRAFHSRSVRICCPMNTWKKMYWLRGLIVRCRASTQVSGTTETGYCFGKFNLNWLMVSQWILCLFQHKQELSSVYKFIAVLYYIDRLLSSVIDCQSKLGETLLWLLSCLHCTTQGLKYWPWLDHDWLSLVTVAIGHMLGWICGAPSQWVCSRQQQGAIRHLAPS